MNDAIAFETAVKFTETYKRYTGGHKAIREAMCLKQLYPAVLDDIGEHDLFAGGMGELNGLSIPVDFSSNKYVPAQAGFIMNLDEIEALKERVDASRRAKLDEIVEFWLKESTFVKSHENIRKADQDAADFQQIYRAKIDKRKFQRGKRMTAKGAGPIGKAPTNRIAGLVFDFDKLLRLGIPGLAAEIKTHMEQARKTGNDTEFHKSMLICMDILRDVCRHYEVQARRMAERTGHGPRKTHLENLARILAELPEKRPTSLLAAIQLMWLYCQLGRAANWGRMDVYLGDFLAQDIDSGRLSQEEAEVLVIELWRRIKESEPVSDPRITIGGMGRRNESNADRFAMIAMEAARKYKSTRPVLTMRFHKKQNPALMKKALDVIGEGCLYPTLYNDDVYIAGVRRSMDIPLEDAQKWLVLGCGEILLDHTSVGSPNSWINIPKALEAVLHNGHDAIAGNLIGLETGSLKSISSFEILLDTFKRQLRHCFELCVKIQAADYRELRKECAFLYESILHDDCIARGKALLDGGIRRQGGCCEGFGFTNAADSLLAIRKLVYEEKRLSLERLVEILDADFVGFEKERRWMLDIPKYGNNDAEADALLLEITSFINKTCKDIGRENGLDYYFAASVNPGGILFGYDCGATADGRKLGEPFAVGNSPTAGFDKNGITALLASIAKCDAANGGYITNLKLSREMFVNHRVKLEALLNTFFDNGGMQLNITVVNRNDLENAMKEPEKYSHVLIRVGGYSARFIDLDDITKREVLARTLY